MIEDLLRSERRPAKLTVISNDRQVQDAGRSRGCVVLGCEAFVDALLAEPKAAPLPADDKPPRSMTTTCSAAFSQPKPRPKKPESLVLHGIRSMIATAFLRSPSVSPMNRPSRMGAKLVKPAGGSGLTEGPAPDADGNVYFTDQPNDRIHIWSTDGKLSTFMEPCGCSSLCSTRRAGFGPVRTRRTNCGEST
ncbi:MAG: hypothetical protein U0791_15400 [Gemmataceae bacterium]